MYKILLKKSNLINLFYLLLFILLFNFSFLLTDLIANKVVDWKGIFYSPISNENWLLFWGSFSASIATVLLLIHYKEQLSFDKNKYYYDLELSAIKKEKEIVLKLLSAYDTSILADFIQISQSISSKLEALNMLMNRDKEKTTQLNLKRLELEFLTSLKVSDSSLKFDNFDKEKIENLKKSSYDKICVLHDFFLLLKKDSYDRAKKYILENRSLEEIHTEKNINFFIFLNGRKEYFDKCFNKLFTQDEKIENLFYKDSICSKSLFNDVEKDEIINFFKNYYKNFNIEDFDKINFEFLFSSSFFVPIFISFFEETTHSLTLYYQENEKDLLKNTFSYKF
ncbi:hypothetical protein H3N56_10265 [Cetobacterium sp. 2A]|uniref:hypothetical protein n=1 Tax=Cetobacterium sp. 2A TaxID=2754723 RepID=UPI00163C4A74|nr:hypothetical protein [Cetobacterium sp. 2A]MBC2856824.1 hypothetical protein [Cetobacterium sp. 2A]